MPLVREALRGYTHRLTEAGVDSPRLSAEVLLAHAMGRDRIALISEATSPLATADLDRAEHFLSRREKGEPVAYIMGVKEFYGLDFQVTPATLIPRPETEHIIEEAEKLYSLDAPIQFLDLGTGSGALAVTLSVRFPQSSGMALDISEEALTVAQRNAVTHGVADRVQFVCADFMQSLPLEDVDLIVANPPYVSAEECDALSPEVADYEPRTALYSANNGLAHYRGLLPHARNSLKSGGILLMEIGYRQGEALLEMLDEFGSGFENSVIISDLAGLDRVIRATRCG